MSDICDTFNQFNHDNWFGDEDAPDFVEELKDCAGPVLAVMYDSKL